MTTDGYTASKREVPNWDHAAIELKKQTLDTPQAIHFIEMVVDVVGDEDKKEEIESRLSNFLLAVFKAWLDDDCFAANEIHLRAVANHFVDALLTGSSYYVTQFYLQSLFVEEPVILSDTCLLRQFTKHDMLSLLESGCKGKHMLFHQIGTVLEVQGRFQHTSSALKKAKKVLFYLSLFAPVQPQMLITQTFCADISNANNDKIEEHRWRNEWFHETWIIDSKQKAHFEYFYALAERASIDDSLYWHEKDEIDPLYLPYRMYTESMGSNFFEATTAFAMIGIDSLVAVHEPKQRNKLCRRVAKLLNIVSGSKYPFEVVRDKIDKAYDVRNKYVHGNLYSREERLEMLGKINLRFEDDAQWSVADCLRLLLVIYALAPVDRNKMRDLVDEACSSEEGERKLRDVAQTSFRAARLSCVDCIKPFHWTRRRWR